MATIDNKKVAKNTLILYVRMAITMLIGLWTSRLVLNALGFTDQGLYNVVGGVIGFSSLITGAISNSISRFITYETGRGDLDMVNKVIQNAITVQWTLAIIVMIIGETLGLWFINNKLVIPDDRLYAVNCVYQFSLIGLAIYFLISAPNAIIVANEKMNIYAGVAIANSLVTLSIALAITYFKGDRLILYAFLQFCNSLCVTLFYWIYIRRKFPEIKQRLGFDKNIFKPIFSFAGWNAIGTSAAIIRGSGTSVLLNMFGGPVANTINGIANSVNQLATIFISDFTIAYRPQIVKRYASEEYESLVNFLNQCAKFSYSLLVIMAIPVLFNVQPLLILWLKKIPDGTVPFAVLIVIISLIDSLSRPLICAKDATGEIRNYQIVVGGILLLTIPISYAFLKLGLPIYFAIVAILITSIAAFFARMIMLKDSIPGWSSWQFIKTTVFRCLLATIACILLPFMMHIYFPAGIISTFVQCAVGVIWCAGCVYLFAMNRNEKIAVKEFIINKFIKINLSD